MQVLRPAALAAYIAWSAWRSSSTGVSPSSGKQAMPMLAEM
jgi:hypothetical protein